MLGVCSALGASWAEAQIPGFELPVGDEAPAKDKSKATPTADEDTDAPKKTYQRPEPKPLPDQKPEVLSGPIVLVPFDAMVNPGIGDYVRTSIQQAESKGAQAVLIELNTPGGLVATTQKIVESILGSKLPIIVYVTPSGAHAASAGTFITLAGHVAAMAPATRIGAAHPVTGSGKDPEEDGGKHMGRKVENDLVALVEGIAKERNRNIEWAEDAVRNSVSADAEDALKLGIIDVVARDRKDLFQQLDGMKILLNGRVVQFATKDAVVEVYDKSLRQSVLDFLANPGVAALIGLLGFLGIIIEIYHPGMIVPGVVGVLAVICFLISADQLPINIGAGLLVVAGVGLLVAEMYTPAYGALGLIGTVGVGLGLMLFVDPSRPDFAVDPSIRLGWLDILPVILLLGGFLAYLMIFVVRAKRGRPTTGCEGLVGEEGSVLEEVGPEGGMIFVSGEYWRAVAPETIGKGEAVEVASVSGLELEVRRKRGTSKGS
jgi:membrane-bound serine protease (ClpP class)